MRPAIQTVRWHQRGVHYQRACATPTFSPAAGTHGQRTIGDHQYHHRWGDHPLHHRRQLRRRRRPARCTADAVSISANCHAAKLSPMRAALPTERLPRGSTSSAPAVPSSCRIDFTGANGTSLIGRAPDVINLPGGTYIVSGSTATWGVPQIQGNAAQVNCDIGALVSIASNRSCKPTRFSILASLNPQSIVDWIRDSVAGIGILFRTA